MSTTTKSAHGTAGVGPVRSGQRTGADLLADVVSLVVLLALGGFAIAVSFSHTMVFVRAHGQSQGWVVYGTALTVVGVTVQSGMEVHRDSRYGRGRGWPAVLLAVGVVVELYANASTAGGPFMNRVVAAWPVLVAAAALALWTRRLQHAAEAADLAGDTVAATLWEIPAERRPAAAAAYLEHNDDQDQDDDQDDDEPDPLADELAALPTAKDRGLFVLSALSAMGEPVPSAAALAERIGCTRQHAHSVLNEWQARPENQPGQSRLFGDLSAVPA